MKLLFFVLLRLKLHTTSGNYEIHQLLLTALYEMPHTCVANCANKIIRKT